MRPLLTVILQLLAPLPGGVGRGRAWEHYVVIAYRSLPHLLVCSGTRPHMECLMHERQRERRGRLGEPGSTEGYRVSIVQSCDQCDPARRFATIRRGGKGNIARTNTS